MVVLDEAVHPDWLVAALDDSVHLCRTPLSSREGRTSSGLTTRAERPRGRRADDFVKLNEVAPTRLRMVSATAQSATAKQIADECGGTSASRLRGRPAAE